MKIQADQVHRGDKIVLAFDTLTIRAYGIVKRGQLYTHIKLWFDDNTTTILPRTQEIEVER